MSSNCWYWSFLDFEDEDEDEGCPEEVKGFPSSRRDVGNEAYSGTAGWNLKEWRVFLPSGVVRRSSKLWSPVGLSRGSWYSLPLSEEHVGWRSRRLSWHCRCKSCGSLGAVSCSCLAGPESMTSYATWHFSTTHRSSQRPTPKMTVTAHEVLRPLLWCRSRKTLRLNHRAWLSSVCGSDFTRLPRNCRTTLT